MSDQSVVPAAPAHALSTDTLALGGIVLITLADIALAAFAGVSMAAVAGLSAPVVTGLFALIKGRP